MDVERRLIRAIHNKTLAKEVRELLTEAEMFSEKERNLLERALATSDEIRRSCCSEGEKIASRIQNAGVPCHFDKAELGDPQYHQVYIEIEGDVSKALTVATQLGYNWLGASLGAAWQVYRRRKVLLTKEDNETRRLVIHWHARTLGFLKPFWSITFASEPFGILLRKAGWQKDSSSVGGYLGTPIQLIPELLNFANVKSSDVLLDLGCGDGRVLIEAAHRIGCRGVGYEHELRLCEIARKRAETLAVTGLIEIHHADVSVASLKDASVVFLFLPPLKVAEILPDLLMQLPPHGRVIAHEILPIHGTSEQSKIRPIFSHSGLTVAHLWRPFSEAAGDNK